MELLKKLYGIYSGSRKEEPMRKFLKSYIKRNIPTAKISEDKGNIYIIKGKSDTYPCIVAHTDQVQQPYPKDYVVLFDGITFTAIDCATRKHCGLGADDKNGIWIALRALEKYPAMKCVFFYGEEVGMLGSKVADMTFFDDCRWVIQCDRKGHQDFINHTNGVEVCNKKFADDANIKSHKYSIQSGLATDVGQLKINGLKVCAVNLSCGYYEAHTSSEYTVWPDLLKCQALVEHMVEKMTNVYKHEYKKPVYNSSYDGYYSRSGWGTHFGYTPKRYTFDEVVDEICEDMEHVKRSQYGDDWTEDVIRRVSGQYYNQYGYSMKFGEPITYNKVLEVVNGVLDTWAMENEEAEAQEAQEADEYLIHNGEDVCEELAV